MVISAQYIPKRNLKKQIYDLGANDILGLLIYKDINDYGRSSVQGLS